MANLGYIQVTRRCNQKCLFCSNPEIDADIELDEAEKLVVQLAREGYDGVVLTGGEPTLWDDLPRLVTYAASHGLPPRIVTNGQRLGKDPEWLARMVEAGLHHVHLSLYSHLPEVVARLTGVEESLAYAQAALERLSEYQGRVAVDVNTVINSANADHLDQIVDHVLRNYPFVRHFVFNNLDPFMNRVADHPDTVPALWQFELSLHRAMSLLHHGGRTFRVERVPLCYMTAFAHCSTETRKIVKSEERTTHFLDDKGKVRQTEFTHDKAECCRVCRLDPVCAGLDGVGQGFELFELAPVFVPARRVASRVLGVPLDEIADGLAET